MAKMDRLGARKKRAMTNFYSGEDTRSRYRVSDTKSIVKRKPPRSKVTTAAPLGNLDGGKQAPRLDPRKRP